MSIFQFGMKSVNACCCFFLMSYISIIFFYVDIIKKFLACPLTKNSSLVYFIFIFLIKNKEKNPVALALDHNHVRSKIVLLPQFCSACAHDRYLQSI